MKTRSFPVPFLKAFYPRDQPHLTMLSASVSPSVSQYDKQLSCLQLVLQHPSEREAREGRARDRQCEKTAKSKGDGWRREQNTVIAAFGRLKVSGQPGNTASPLHDRSQHHNITQ